MRTQSLIIWVSLLLFSASTGYAGKPKLFTQLHKPCRFCKLMEPAAKTEVRKEMTKRVILFTATWCGPCQELKPGLEALKRMGWKIDETNNAHIQIVDVDSTVYNKFKEYGLEPPHLPYAILIETDENLIKPIKRLDSPTWITISHLYFDKKAE